MYKLILFTIMLIICFGGCRSKESSKLNSDSLNANPQNNTETDLKKKELDLKERELALKERELDKQNSQQQNLNSPEGVVTKFIQSIGKQDWSAAFGLMTEKRRGNYSTFSSKKGYGGITRTSINSCTYIGESDGKKEVKVDYESIDPSNKSGRFKQYFYLIPFNDSYLISEIKNIDIEWY
jgi:hypothetical protein